MAKRNRQDLAVSLFPFLSILACVIGVLTLMITGLAIAQLDNKGDTPEEVERAEAYLKLEKQKKKDEAETENMRLAIKTTSQNQSVQAIARNSLAELKEKQAALKKAQDEAKNLQAQRDALIKQKADKTKLRDTKKKELGNAKKKLAAENTRINQKPGVRVQPGGSGLNLKPTFVECNAKGVVLHHGAKPLVILRAQMATHLGFIKLLDQVAQQKDGSVIFLVRPKGVSNYYHARNIARTRYTRNGKLPVPGEGALDLTVFRNVLKNQKPN
jgi:hypothetical protein